MAKEDIINLAMRQHIEDIKIIAEMDNKITMFRSEGGIAKEAIDRYCPPELLDSARIWLKSKGLL